MKNAISRILYPSLWASGGSYLSGHYVATMSQAALSDVTSEHGLAPSRVCHRNMLPHCRVCFTDTFHLKRCVKQRRCCMVSVALSLVRCYHWTGRYYQLLMVAVCERCSDFPPHRSSLRSDQTTAYRLQTTAFLAEVRRPQSVDNRSERSEERQGNSPHSLYIIPCFNKKVNISVLISLKQVYF